jgi:hypothetical protein
MLFMTNAAHRIIRVAGLSGAARRLRAALFHRTGRRHARPPEVGVRVILERIANRIAAGELPGQPPTGMWVSQGASRQCDGCGRPIATSQREYGFTWAGGIRRFHDRCLSAWEAARTFSSGRTVN